MKEPDMYFLCNPHTVVARFLVEADAIADPKALLAVFTSGVESFAEVEPKVKKLLDVLADMQKAQDRNEPWEVDRLRGQWATTIYGDVSTVYWAVQTSFKQLKQIAQVLFLAILQQYAVPPNKAKKVQAAARFWSKTKMVLRKDKSPWAPRHAEEVVAYGGILSTYREQVALITDIVTSAKLHGEEATPKLKAGPFTLVNTGNFPPKVMEDVRQTVEKAAAAMTRVGLGKVCYGDVMVTNTITSKSTVLAFYLPAHDEMFVRANVKPSIDSVDTVCHELAHRLENKFLQSARGEIQALYRTINRHVGLGPPTEGWPEVGHAVEYKGDKLVVLNVNRYTNKIQFGEPPTAGKMSRRVYTAPSLEWWAKNIEGRELERGPDFKGFITPYAKSGGPSENFAEMVSYYAAGKLPSGLVELLEPILG